ncbi:hypothetical protein AGMMS49545_18080 [Betaproteobacteria bacterium]|nr:hypothetical protein AGMMS49545_18080 [Betaproteobacteria bacterium]GHU44652.1 hypothetical protein AGMMS50289_13450 [Betaproteobacteria bacterium]
MRTSLLLTALLSIALIPVAGQAEVYKWKDAQGRTVISDTPQPGAGKAVEKVPSATTTLDPNTSAAGKQSNTAPSVADQELEFKKRQQERQEAEKKAALDKAEAAKKTEGCDRAQRNLKTLESGERVTIPNEKGGHEYINDQQRQQETTRARQNVKDWCE